MIRAEEFIYATLVLQVAHFKTMVSVAKMDYHLPTTPALLYRLVTLRRMCGCKRKNIVSNE
jgi:hypothetical protein